MNRRNSLATALAAALAGTGVVLAGETAPKKENGAAPSAPNAPKEFSDMTSHSPAETQAAGKRSAELKIDVKASPAALWKALTDADELTRWFPISARVKPGVGGAIFTAFGPGQEWESPITIWEPEKHLRVLWCPPNTPEPDLFGVDYFIEPRSGGVTRLRLVHFGFSKDPSWDVMYDGVSRGWDTMLWGLQIYLEQHLGTPRNVVHINANLGSTSREEAWKKAFSPQGYIRDASLMSLKPGDRFRTRVGPVEISGVVRNIHPNKDFQALVESMDNAILRIQMDPCKGGPGDEISVMLATFGQDPKTLESIRSEWVDHTARLFGPEATAVPAGKH